MTAHRRHGLEARGQDGTHSGSLQRTCSTSNSPCSTYARCSLVRGGPAHRWRSRGTRCWRGPSSARTPRMENIKPARHAGPCHNNSQNTRHDRVVVESLLKIVNPGSSKIGYEQDAPKQVHTGVYVHIVQCGWKLDGDVVITLPRLFKPSPHYG